MGRMEVSSPIWGNLRKGKERGKEGERDGERSEMRGGGGRDREKQNS